MLLLLLLLTTDWIRLATVSSDAAGIGAVTVIVVVFACAGTGVVIIGIPSLGTTSSDVTKWVTVFVILGENSPAYFITHFLNAWGLIESLPATANNIPLKIFCAAGGKELSTPP
jgi:hypothetical protein